MKKKIKLFLSSVVFICGIFTSCENLLSVKEEKQTEQSYIRISTNLSSVDRSVLPSNYFTKDTTGLTWTLSGSLNGTAEITIEVWNDEGDTAAITQTAYQKMISDSFIPVDEGTWIFTLTAKNNSGKVLEATITQTITGGQNTLVFDMKEAVGKGAASGQIEFTLKWEKLSIVDNVVSTLSKRNDSNFSDITSNLSPLPSAEKNYEYVSYSAEADSPLTPGNYILKLELQQDTTEATENPSAEPNYTTINTYTCLIHVAPGLCSKGEVTLKTLAPLYKVIFDGIEGIDFEESIVSLSYNAYTTFALPTIKEEDGYEYEYQWHKTGRDSATGAYIDELIKDPLKVCINENAYTFVLYRYKIVDKNDIVRTPKGDSTTGESFSIDTAEGLGIFRDLVNGCNENLKMVDNSGESEEVFVYYETGSSRSQLNATLTSDIDLTHDADGNELSWVPINGYSGTFDGGDHTITVNNTYQVNGNLYYQGFFDTLDGATIKNLVVAGEETISELKLDYCGGIASQIKNQRSVNTTFENCVNKRNITVSADVKGIGGFAGYTSSNSSETTNFVNCINLGTIENNYNASEYYEPYVAGFTSGATSYRNCINAGNVTGATFAFNETSIFGTVAGFDANASASFTDCINLGDISANSYTADDGVTYSTEKVYGFSSIESDNFPSFENCIDAGSAKQPFTGFVDNTIGKYDNSYYNSDSYGSNYNTDVLSCMSSNDLCIQEKTKFSNWSYDSSNSRYPLPNIVKSETTEGVSSEIWQEVVAKAIPKVSNFTMLQERIASASGTAENPEVIVLNGTINIAEKLEITTPIKIIASTSEGVTITRGADDAGKVFTGAFFDNQSTLTLEGITLDGGKDLQIQATAPLITSSDDLTLNNCTLQNNKNTSTTPGGAINISAGTFTMNGGVIGNVISEDVESKKSWEYAANADSYSNYAAAGGGGIYVASGDVTIDNATISYNYTPNPDENLEGENKENLKISHGGGISVVEGNLTINNAEVSYNSGYQGAGVKCYSDNKPAGTVTLKHATIKGNASWTRRYSNYGGGLMVKNFTVKFEGDTPSVIEENYSGDGGALFLENTTSTLQNITIQNNFYNENGYKNGSEVLLYSGANVSIGSSDVTIKSADGETRGIFMNNNNTLNLSGDAKLDTPIYLTNGAMVTVSAALTSNESIVATITPEQYNEGTQVVNASEDVNIEGKFAVTPKINAEDNSTTEYTIDSSGMLQLDE